MRNAYIRRHKLINKKTFILAAQRFSGWKLEYALSGKGGKKVIPLTPTNCIQYMEMQWNTPFQGCISSSSSTC